MSRQFTLNGNARRFALSLAAVAAVLGIGALSVTYAFGAPAPTATATPQHRPQRSSRKSGATRGRPTAWRSRSTRGFCSLFAPS